MKRESFLSQLIFALIVFLIVALFISGHLAAGRATVAQDPKATLPSPKKTPTPKKKPPLAVRKPAPAKKTTLAFRPANPGIELVRIPAGSFMMGSTAEQSVHRAEQPVHVVTINYSFYMG